MKLIEWWRGGASYTSEYQAVLDYATSQGYSHPSSSQKTKQNTFLTALKDAGIWNNLDLLYVFLTDGSENFAKINWKSPGTYQATNSGSVTFIAGSGIKSGGGTITTGFTPSTQAVKFTLNEAGFFTDTDSVSASSQSQLGCGGASDRIIAQFGRGSYALSSAQENPVINNTTGFYHAHRTASNLMTLYRNGVSIDTSTNTTTSLPSAALLLLGFPGFPDTDQSLMRCFGLGASLTGKETALYNAWTSYVSSL